MVQHLTKEWIAKRLPKRPIDANKGTFGKVLVIAGSENYPGAAYLACAAAYRIGIGLVTLVTESEVKIIISRKLPELTFLSFEEIFENLYKYNVLLLGPGIGQNDVTNKFVEQLLKEKLPKMIIDGDGLNILSKTDKWWDSLDMDVILTPHPKEMSRLTGLTMDEIQSDREKTATSFAKKWGTVVVLKGANTLVASPAGELAFSPFANPALATAGTGDILSGIIAGFLAQGLTLFDAACCGVYVHGMAGELVREKTGEAGVMASDLIPTLPKVIKSLKQY